MHYRYIAKSTTKLVSECLGNNYYSVYFSAFQEVGGYEALQYKYMQAVPKLTHENTSCGLPRDDSWIMLRHPVNSDLPWPAFLLGQTPASIWYWCADQVCPPSLSRLAFTR